MALNRETIYAALKTRLTGYTSLASLLTTQPSRRFRDLSQVDPSEMPALFIVQDSDKPISSQKGLPPEWVLYGALFIYARTDDPAVEIGTTLNSIEFQIEKALEWQASDGGPPRPSAPTDLKIAGVQRVEISGVDYGEHAQSGTSILIVHFEIYAVGTT